jgi:arylsulfatase A-like enzyme
VGGLLKDPNSESPHEKTGFYYFRNSRLEAIRLGDWKLHFKRKLELYDVRQDIAESKNLAETETELVERLTAVAERYHADLKANTRPAWSGRPRSSPDK